MLNTPSRAARFRKTSVSYGDYDPDDPYSARTNRSSFLQLERLYPHYNFNSFVYLHTSGGEQSSVNSDLDVLDDYLAFFNSFVSDSDIRIELPFLLRYKTSAALSARGAESVPASIYSVSLEFKAAGNKLIYGSGSMLVTIPILSRDPQSLEPTSRSNSDLDSKSSPANSVNSYGNVAVTEEVSAKLADKLERGTFPSAYSFLLDVGLSVPLPTQFSIKATFNTEEGNVSDVDLDPLPLTLKDMFIPVMAARTKRELPAPFSAAHPLPYACALFESMWTAIQNEGEGLSQTRRISDKQREEFATSVKYLDRPAERVVKVMQVQLAPFLLDPVETSSINKGEIRAFFFLPKSFHLLMRFKIQDDSTTVVVATDFWRILGFVDRFFDDVLPRQF